MQIDRTNTYKIGLLLAAFLFAAALQSFAFTEPSGAAPLGDAYAPINTGPGLQDKSDPNFNAWILADHLGSRYTTVLASVAGSNVGIGTTTPVAKLEVKGEVRIGNTGLACTNSTSGTLRWSGSAVEVCNGSSWGALSSGGGTADLCSVSGNILGGTHTYAQCCTAGGTVTSIGAGNYVCKFTGTTCKTGWTKYQNWTTSAPSYCTTPNNGSCYSNSCVTTSHAFSNTVAETCGYVVMAYSSESNGMSTCDYWNYTYGTCTAQTTEVGCQ